MMERCWQMTPFWPAPKRPIYWLAGSWISVRRSRLSRLIPKQRATISLPTGQLAKAIEVSGTLAKPKVGVNTGDLVTGSAKTAFFFMGGWIYVMSKKEWDKRSEEEGACQKARDYWLGHSLAQMKEHVIDEKEQEAEKSASRKSHGPARRHSRRPR